MVPMATVGDNELARVDLSANHAAVGLVQTYRKENYFKIRIVFYNIAVQLK